MSGHPRRYCDSTQKLRSQAVLRPQKRPALKCPPRPRGRRRRCRRRHRPRPRRSPGRCRPRRRRRRPRHRPPRRRRRPRRLLLGAAALGVGVLERNELDVGDLRNLRGLRDQWSDRRTRRLGPHARARVHDGMEHRLALRADDRVLRQIIEFRTATAAQALGAELGFCHRNPRCWFGKRRLTWRLAAPLSIGRKHGFCAAPALPEAPRRVVGEGEKDRPWTRPYAARRPPLRPAQGPRPRARRQVDLAPRPDPRRADGRARPAITGLLEGEDVINTGKAMRALGATRRAHRARAPGACTGSGSAGFAAAGRAARFRQFRHRLPPGHRGGRGLPDHARPSTAMPRCASGRCGACSTRSSAWARGASSVAEGGRLPLTLAGARDPIPIVYEPPAASAQLKSAVLLAGLAAPGETTVIEKEATRDHTERMLRHFGASVRVEPDGAHGRRITLNGQPELAPAPVAVPADPSSAAFPLVAALIVPGSRGDPRRRDAQPAAHRPVRDPARDGRRRSRSSTGATRAARTSPTCACAQSR